MSQLASAHASLGELEVGLRLLDEGVDLAEATGERFFEAELHRLRGAVLLELDRRSEAEAELQRALAIARQQQARWCEPIYTWFTEGSDTPDLKDAKILLDQLRSLSGTERPPTDANS